MIKKFQVVVVAANESSSVHITKVVEKDFMEGMSDEQSAQIVRDDVTPAPFMWMRDVVRDLETTVNITVVKL